MVRGGRCMICRDPLHRLPHSPHGQAHMCSLSCHQGCVGMLTMTWVCPQCGPRCGIGQVLVTCQSSRPHRTAPSLRPLLPETPSPYLPPPPAPLSCPVCTAHSAWSKTPGGLTPLASDSVLQCLCDASSQGKATTAPSASRSCDFLCVSAAG